MVAGRPVKHYAVYYGDTFHFIGTKKECAELLNVQEQTISFCKSPSYMRRLEKRGTENALIVVEC